jgi:hypothetical protein
VVRDLDEEVGRGLRRQRVSAWSPGLRWRGGYLAGKIHAGQPQGAGHALGRGLGLPAPFLRAQSRRHPADPARRRQGDRPHAGRRRRCAG